MTTTSLPLESAALDRKHRLVIVASALGTVFEWYDFYIFGTLAVFFGKLFFPPGNEVAAYLSSLALFGVGFSVRPFGALVFGRIGDLIGRKYTFLVTIIVMGLSTALIGVLPTYAQIGLWAPLILVLLRLAQGLALGGEYGGAATYVAEHAPAGKRGAYTSWIQTTATIGLFLSLAVIAPLRLALSGPAHPGVVGGPSVFEAWGWRIPFLVSVLLLAISVYIRLKLEESPIFAEMKAEGKGSKAPLTDSFATWKNAKVVLMSLFGATMGQGVVWYCGQFYALYFLTTTLKLDFITGYVLIAIALLLATPGFVLMGKLSDRIGRKPILLLGCLLPVLTYQPIFHALTRAANPALADAMARSPVVLHTDDYHGRLAVTAQALGDALTKIVRPTASRGDIDRARAYLNGKGIPSPWPRPRSEPRSGWKWTATRSRASTRGLTTPRWRAAAMKISSIGARSSPPSVRSTSRPWWRSWSFSSSTSLWSTARSPPFSSSSFRPGFVTHRCRCPITSATDGSAASCL